MNTETQNNGKLTFNEAKKSIASMNLIDGFLFDSALENKDDAKIVMKSILKVSAHCSPVVTGLYFCPKIVLGRMSLAEIPRLIT